MRTMPITLVAMLDDEVEATANAVVDLDTFEITTDDPDFSQALEDDGLDFYIETLAPSEDSPSFFPVAVDYYDDQPNEFMMMDLQGIEVLQQYAEDNPDLVTETEDFVEDDE